MSSTYNKVMTALFQLRHLNCSTTVYCHNMSVPLITCHQHSHNCFIRMLSMTVAFSITCLLHVINTVIIALLQCQNTPLLLYYSVLPKYVTPLILTFWKAIKLLRTQPVDAKISDGSYRYLAN